MNAVVLLGPPGAGKGTIAAVLVDKGYKHISTGELLREQIRQETPLGIEADKLMKGGQFVPDEVVVSMISDLLKESAKDAKFLFDGFPRTLIQAERLDELVCATDSEIDRVVQLECPADVIVQRLTGRRTCSKCGSVYHATFNPPSNGDVCDIEGCELTQRADDTESTVRKRLDVYEERTAPLIAYYKTKGLIKRINANQPIGDVRADIFKAVG